MGYLQDARRTLENETTTDRELLDVLCELEREYGNAKALIKMGFSEDIHNYGKLLRSPIRLRKS
jgi:hypothetical protein